MKDLIYKFDIEKFNFAKVEEISERLDFGDSLSLDMNCVFESIESFYEFSEDYKELIYNIILHANGSSKVTWQKLYAK